jgi:hypothetical protein
MMNEEKRESVAMGISMLGLYKQQVLEDLGLEKALEYARAREGTPTLKQLVEVISGSLNGFGQDFSLKTGKDRVDITINECPFYNGLASVGIPNETITQFYKSGGGASFCSVRYLIPVIMWEAVLDVREPGLE